MFTPTYEQRPSELVVQQLKATLSAQLALHH